MAAHSSILAWEIPRTEAPVAGGGVEGGVAIVHKVAKSQT